MVRHALFPKSSTSCELCDHGMSQMGPCDSRDASGPRASQCKAVLESCSSRSCSASTTASASRPRCASTAEHSRAVSARPGCPAGRHFCGDSAPRRPHGADPQHVPSRAAASHGFRSEMSAEKLGIPGSCFRGGKARASALKSLTRSCWSAISPQFLGCIVAFAEAVVQNYICAENGSCRKLTPCLAKCRRASLLRLNLTLQATFAQETDAVVLTCWHLG